MGVWDWIVDFVISGLESLLGWVGGNLLTILRGIKNLVDGAVNAFYEFSKDPIGKIKEWSATAQTIVSSWLATMWANITEFTAWLRVWFNENILDTLVGVGNFINTAWTTWLNSFYNWAVEFYNWATGAVNEIWNGLTAAWTAINKVIYDAQLAWINFAAGIGTAWLKVLATIVSTATGIYNTLIVKAVEAGGIIYNLVAGSLQGIMDAFGSIFGESQDEIDDRFKEGEKPNWEDVDTTYMHW